ncbi:CopD family protein [Falsirhodobacter algicola]|uniref:Protoporphyrinogen IX oxidase n=1 Tax=Falsirhodobacter algicola TaxID=2692330 RepID=A0A8J8MW56_9RHOB|nr:CopD family protein [Falsirhodobacter algicola]QUS37278.1 hypothetical protein GR316_12910 [Falsirhodobacter algicola]
MIEIAKSLHIAAIALWAAGLVSLPGLYLKRAGIADTKTLLQLQTIVRFAYVAVISPAAFVAIGSGIALIFLQGTFEAWFSAKMTLVALLAIVHVLSGLVVIRLFREGQTYPLWRFAVVMVATGGIILAILFLVLAKPSPPALPADIFRPGALGEMLAPFNPWAKP